MQALGRNRTASQPASIHEHPRASTSFRIASPIIDPALALGRIAKRRRCIGAFATDRDDGSSCHSHSIVAGGLLDTS